MPEARGTPPSLIAPAAQGTWSFSICIYLWWQPLADLLLHPSQQSCNWFPVLNLPLECLKCFPFSWQTLIGMKCNFGEAVSRYIRKKGQGRLPRTKHGRSEHAGGVSLRLHLVWSALLGPHCESFAHALLLGLKPPSRTPLTSQTRALELPGNSQALKSLLYLPPYNF